MGRIAVNILQVPYGQVWSLIRSEAPFGFGSSSWAICSKQVFVFGR